MRQWVLALILLYFIVTIFTINHVSAYDRLSQRNSRRTSRRQRSAPTSSPSSPSPQTSTPPQTSQQPNKQPEIDTPVKTKNKTALWLEQPNVAHALGIDMIGTISIPLSLNVLPIGFNGDGHLGLTIPESVWRHWMAGISFPRKEMLLSGATLPIYNSQSGNTQSISQSQRMVDESFTPDISYDVSIDVLPGIYELSESILYMYRILHRFEEAAQHASVVSGRELSPHMFIEPQLISRLIQTLFASASELIEDLSQNYILSIINPKRTWMVESLLMNDQLDKVLFSIIRHSTETSTPAASSETAQEGDKTTTPDGQPSTASPSSSTLKNDLNVLHQHEPYRFPPFHGFRHGLSMNELYAAEDLQVNTWAQTLLERTIHHEVSRIESRLDRESLEIQSEPLLNKESKWRSMSLFDYLDEKIMRFATLSREQSENKDTQGRSQQKTKKNPPAGRHGGSSGPNSQNLPQDPAQHLAESIFGQHLTQSPTAWLDRLEEALNIIATQSIGGTGNILLSAHASALPAIPSDDKTGVKTGPIKALNSLTSAQFKRAQGGGFGAFGRSARRSALLTHNSNGKQSKAWSANAAVSETRQSHGKSSTVELTSSKEVAKLQQLDRELHEQRSKRLASGANQATSSLYFTEDQQARYNTLLKKWSARVHSIFSRFAQELSDANHLENELDDEELQDALRELAATTISSDGSEPTNTNHDMIPDPTAGGSPVDRRAQSFLSDSAASPIARQAQTTAQESESDDSSDDSSPSSSSHSLWFDGLPPQSHISLLSHLLPTQLALQSYASHDLLGPVASQLKSATKDAGDGSDDDSARLSTQTFMTQTHAVPPFFHSSCLTETFLGSGRSALVDVTAGAFLWGQGAQTGSGSYGSPDHPIRPGLKGGNSLPNADRLLALHNNQASTTSPLGSRDELVMKFYDIHGLQGVQVDYASMLRDIAHHRSLPDVELAHKHVQRAQEIHQKQLQTSGIDRFAMMMTENDHDSDSMFDIIDVDVNDDDNNGNNNIHLDNSIDDDLADGNHNGGMAPLSTSPIATQPQLSFGSQSKWKTGTSGGKNNIMRNRLPPAPNRAPTFKAPAYPSPPASPPPPSASSPPEANPVPKPRSTTATLFERAMEQMRQRNPHLGKRSENDPNNLLNEVQAAIAHAERDDDDTKPKHVPLDPVLKSTTRPNENIFPSEEAIKALLDARAKSLHNIVQDQSEQVDAKATDDDATRAPAHAPVPGHTPAPTPAHVPAPSINTAVESQLQEDIVAKVVDSLIEGQRLAQEQAATLGDEDMLTPKETLFDDSHLDEEIRRLNKRRFPPDPKTGLRHPSQRNGGRASSPPPSSPSASSPSSSSSQTPQQPSDSNKEVDSDKYDPITTQKQLPPATQQSLDRVESEILLLEQLISSDFCTDGLLDCSRYHAEYAELRQRRAETIQPMKKTRPSIDHNGDDQIDFEKISKSSDSKNTNQQGKQSSSSDGDEKPILVSNLKTHLSLLEGDNVHEDDILRQNDDNTSPNAPFSNQFDWHEDQEITPPELARQRRIDEALDEAFSASKSSHSAFTAAHTLNSVDRLQAVLDAMPNQQGGAAPAGGHHSHHHNMYSFAPTTGQSAHASAITANPGASLAAIDYYMAHTASVVNNYVSTAMTPQSTSMLNGVHKLYHRRVHFTLFLVADHDLFDPLAAFNVPYWDSKQHKFIWGGNYDPEQLQRAAETAKQQTSRRRQGTTEPINPLTSTISAWDLLQLAIEQTRIRGQQFTYSVQFVDLRQDLLLSLSLQNSFTTTMAPASHSTALEPVTYTITSIDTAVLFGAGTNAQTKSHPFLNLVTNHVAPLPRNTRHIPIIWLSLASLAQSQPVFLDQHFLATVRHGIPIAIQTPHTAHTVQNLNTALRASQHPFVGKQSVVHAPQCNDAMGTALVPDPRYPLIPLFHASIAVLFGLHAQSYGTWVSPLGDITGLSLNLPQSRIDLLHRQYILTALRTSSIITNIASYSLTQIPTSVNSLCLLEQTYNSQTDPLLIAARNTNIKTTTSSIANMKEWDGKLIYKLVRKAYRSVRFDLLQLRTFITSNDYENGVKFIRSTIATAWHYRGLVDLLLAHTDDCSFEYASQKQLAVLHKQHNDQRENQVTGNSGSGSDGFFDWTTVTNHLNLDDVWNAIVGSTNVQSIDTSESTTRDTSTQNTPPISRQSAAATSSTPSTRSDISQSSTTTTQPTLPRSSLTVHSQISSTSRGVGPFVWFCVFLFICMLSIFRCLNDTRVILHNRNKKSD